MIILAILFAYYTPIVFNLFGYTNNLYNIFCLIIIWYLDNRYDFISID